MRQSALPFSLIALFTTALLTACGSSSAPLANTAASGTKACNYNADITRTAMGVPHITADSYCGMGYGVGYAQAEDNLCLIMEEIIVNRGEHARYFGAGGRYVSHAIGTNMPSVESDFFWKMMNSDEEIAPIKSASVPEAHDASKGYVNGFNRYLREVKAGAHAGRHLRCRSEDWLTPLVEDDMWRRYHRLAMLASSAFLAPGIAEAQPPVSTGRSAPQRPSAKMLAKLDREEMRSKFPVTSELKIGSNMWGLGADATTTGSSLLFVNPHFPWAGTERLYMMHLTVPGTLDIMGSSLYGLPAVLIGMNEKFAWSHTVSSAYRFAAYELNMVGPTSYRYDGGTRELRAFPLSIQVKQGDGSLATQTRTLYMSHYGPMVGLKVSGQNIFPWTATSAYTIRDANRENSRLINQFFKWDTAADFTEFKALHKSVLGVPWVNTVAVGNGDPEAYYGDVTVVPNVPDALQNDAACRPTNAAIGAVVNAVVPGLPILNGSSSACEWRTDSDAPAGSNTFGPGNLPTLSRRDFVANSNDSYWLTNPAAPLTGFARIIGLEGTARSLRTRKSLVMLSKRADGSDGLGGINKMSREQAKQLVLDNTVHSTTLAMTTVLNDTCAAPTTIPNGSGTLVDIAPACAVLAAWDQSYGLNARGAQLWKEFWKRAQAATGFYATAFSANDPVNTPRDPRGNLPEVKKAMADAVTELNDKGIALDAPFGQVQFSGVNTAAGDARIPMFGTEGNQDGGFTIGRGNIASGGYPVNFGNSHVAVISYEGGRLNAEGFITYSQSTDPTSPHYSDWTQAYSNKQWVRLPFYAHEIAADRISGPLSIGE